jgi:hypothetical protein
VVVVGFELKNLWLLHRSLPLEPCLQPFLIWTGSYIYAWAYLALDLPIYISWTVGLTATHFMPTLIDMWFNTSIVIVRSLVFFLFFRYTFYTFLISRTVLNLILYFETPYFILWVFILLFLLILMYSSLFLYVQYDFCVLWGGWVGVCVRACVRACAHMHAQLQTEPRTSLMLSSLLLSHTPILYCDILNYKLKFLEILGGLSWAQVYRECH